MTRSDLIDVACVVRHETPKAVLVDHGGVAPVWLPRSLIELAPSDDGRSMIVTLPERFAREKGLI